MPSRTNNDLLHSRAYTFLSRKTPCPSCRTLSNGQVFIEGFGKKWSVFGWTLFFVSFSLFHWDCAQQSLWVLPFRLPCFPSFSLVICLDPDENISILRLISACFSSSMIISHLCFFWVHLSYGVWITQIYLPTAFWAPFFKEVNAMALCYQIRFPNRSIFISGYHSGLAESWFSLAQTTLSSSHLIQTCSLRCQVSLHSCLLWGHDSSWSRWNRWLTPAHHWFWLFIWSWYIGGSEGNRGLLVFQTQ